jgi:hypothetical protein
MPSHRCHLHGLFAALLALVVQLGLGASVPRLDPLREIADAAILCHGAADTGGTPAKVPSHLIDCLLCSHCIAAQPQIPPVPVPPYLAPPRVQLAWRAELPPPSRAPPSRFWVVTQPRAPPFFS